ncbi:MAG: DinB family protein [Dehalococcoidia bacterium]
MNATDLRQAIDQARAEFRSALADAAACWEHPPNGCDAGAWAPRQVAEHVMGAELGYAGAVASALGREWPAWEVFTFASVLGALAAFDHVAGISSAIMGHVIDDDLSANVPSGATVLEVMQKAADHLKEHARQIRAVSP